MRIFWIILGFILIMGGRPAAEETQPPNLIVNGNFEEWEWAPLDSDQIVLTEAKGRLKKGEKLTLEYRGPLYRRLVGYVGFPGRMIDGAAAYQGKSLYLENGCDFGYHGPFYGLLETGREYHWEIALKGKGAFVFKGWVGGVKAGQFKWLGFPALIQVNATDQWQVYQGKFTVPLLATGDGRQESKVAASMVVNNGSALYLDNFKVWPAEGGKPQNAK